LNRALSGSTCSNTWKTKSNSSHKKEKERKKEREKERGKKEFLRASNSETMERGIGIELER
jgi:hypothetical protein